MKIKDEETEVCTGNRWLQRNLPLVSAIIRTERLVCLHSLCSSHYPKIRTSEQVKKLKPVQMRERERTTERERDQKREKAVVKEKPDR